MVDLTVVLLSAPIWVPTIALLAAIIFLDGGNPLYSQDRVGRGGRVFRMWKLRSMVTGAEAMLEDHLAADPEARIEWIEKQKLSVDPRITRFGQFLRKTSLDEVPQMWNVLIGEMSLVGPRPMMVDQQPMYSGTAYYRLRPGLTGTWQIFARNKSAFSDRVSFDEAYDAGLSFQEDVRLILKTAPAVLRAQGL